MSLNIILEQGSLVCAIWRVVTKGARRFIHVLKVQGECRAQPSANFVVRLSGQFPVLLRAAAQHLGAIFPGLMLYSSRRCRDIREISKGLGYLASPSCNLLRRLAKAHVLCVLAK